MTAASPAVARAAARPWRLALLLAAPVGAIAIALVAGAALIAAAGESPLEIYALMLRETLGTGYGLGQTLFKATPLIFTGLAVALGFRAGLFNIGAEGQLVVAAFVAAALAGAGWAAIPGVLKARFGAHEVINTIMLNFVAFALVAWLGRRVFLPATVHTAEIGPGAILPRLGELIAPLRGSPANAAILLALLVAVAVGFLLFRTRLGYELRALGLNAPAAEYGGVSIGRAQVTAMALSGALAGLAGLNFVLGYKHFFELGFSDGVGYMGIAVALVGRNHPLGVVLAALFFGALSYGGLAVNQRVSKEIVDILQGIVILAAICAQPAVERAARRMEG